MKKETQGKAFIKLEKDEVNSLLKAISSQRPSLFIWRAGVPKSVEFKDYTLNSTQKEFSIRTQFSLQHFNLQGKVYLKLIVSEVQYFTSGEISEDDSGISFSISENIFKFERREGIRVVLYPHAEVYLQVKLREIDPGKTPKKILEFKSKTEDTVEKTSIFNRFTMLSKQAGVIDHNGFIKVRIFDISTSGLSFLVGELESEDFSENRMFENIKIEAVKTDILLDQVKTIYNVDYMNVLLPGIKTYKIGFSIEKLSESSKTGLTSFINERLTDSYIRNEFEKFKD